MVFLIDLLSDLSVIKGFSKIIWFEDFDNFPRRQLSRAVQWSIDDSTLVKYLLIKSNGNIKKAMWIFCCLGTAGRFWQHWKFLQFSWSILLLRVVFSCFQVQNKYKIRTLWINCRLELNLRKTWGYALESMGDLNYNTFRL